MLSNITACVRRRRVLNFAEAVQISIFEPSISPKFGLERYAHRVGDPLPRDGGALADVVDVGTACDDDGGSDLVLCSGVYRRVPRLTCDFC
jgi:hypothetical protein